MHPLFEQYQSTLLGRLKTMELSRLSGSEDKLPSDREFFREVFVRWKRNPTVGRFYYKLLDCWRVERLEFPAKFPTKAVMQLLSDLNRTEYFDRIWAEGRVHGVVGTPYRGCLALGHAQRNGEPVYFAAVYSEGEPDRCEFCCVVPDGAENKGIVSVQTSSGWRDIQPEDIAVCPAARVVLAAIRNHLNHIEPSVQDLSRLKQDPADDPPHDEELMRRLNEVVRQRMIVTKAYTQLKYVVPHSLEFCFHLERRRPRDLEPRISRGYRPVMVTYWDGTAFVMSDDYLAYLGYRAAEISEVPVAILGDFPLDRARTEATGGVELLPPVGISFDPVSPTPPTQEFKEWRLEQKLRSSTVTNRPADLIATWMVFAELLADREATERQIHGFVLNHPAVLIPYGTRIESEVWLGKTYRIDLVARASGVRENVTLIELEHHRHKIFTNTGRMRAELTHAVQQVNDWCRWIRENPADAFAASLAGLPTKGVVVAGRAQDLTHEERTRLAHLNSDNPVVVITYDQLLDRLEELILEQVEG